MLGLRCPFEAVGLTIALSFCGLAASAQIHVLARMPAVCGLR